MSAAAEGSEETTPPVTVDAGFFARVLEQDLANMIRKSNSGAPLTKREREMLEAERTRLLKKADPASFTLEGEGPKSPLCGLTQAELAERWGYSLRTIKGWLAEGRAANDPCPLGEPASMAGWFERVHAPRQCPDKLREAVGRVTDWMKGESASVALAEAPKPPVERIEVSEEEKGLLAMLNRHRTAEAELYAKYMRALDDGDEQKASLYMREWSTMGERLRALEKTAPKALEELGIYVRKSEILRELETLHRAVIKSFRQAMRSSRSRLRTAETGEDWNRITDELVDGVCLMLTESDFVEPLVLESGAAA